MREIVGLDSGGRRIALCFLETEQFVHFEVPESDPASEIQQIKGFLRDHLDPLEHDVWLETNMVGMQASIQNALRHAMTIGAVLATVSGTLISPTTWKATVLGHGSAKPDVYALWVEDTSPEVTATIRGITTRKQQRLDCYAAYGIALHGHLARRHPDQLGQGRRVPVRRRRS
jgi:hypothetical protein